MISLYIINNTVLAFVIKFSYYANRSGRARITRNYPIQYRIIKISMNTGDVIREREGEGEREREREKERERERESRAEASSAYVAVFHCVCKSFYRPPLRAPRHEFPTVSRDERAAV